jgi:primosomal replication protein N
VATNLVVLDGKVFKTPTRTQSPSGIEHLHFMLDHQSLQMEADLPRKTFVRIQVIASGNAAQQYTLDLFPGSMIRASGFLSRHESRNGVAKLVLHAQKIERMNEEMCHGTLF